MPSPELATKRSLLAVSRSIESLASRVGAQPGPHAVIALFQDRRYFGYAADVMRALAEHATVLVGYAGDEPPPSPLHHLPLVADEPLVDEWTVLLVSPLATAGLVAVDARRSTAEVSLERGRLFQVELSTDAGWVGEQTARLVDAAGDRLPAAVVGALQDAVAATRSTGPTLPERVLRDELLASWWRTLLASATRSGLEELAFLDPLTQAYNRRFLDRYLARIGPRAPRLAALALDLDRFKPVNDTYGHAAGDAALRAVVGAVRETVRPDDVLVRTGGDEFLLLLPGVAEADAADRAWRIVEAVRALRLPPPAEAATLDVSIGLGVFPAAELDLDAVDRAMYAAKRGGTGVAVVGGGGAVTHVEPAGAGLVSPC